MTTTTTDDATTHELRSYECTGIFVQNYSDPDDDTARMQIILDAHGLAEAIDKVHDTCENSDVNKACFGDTDVILRHLWCRLRP